MKKYLLIFCFILFLFSCGLRSVKDPYFTIEQGIKHFGSYYEVYTQLVLYKEIYLNPFEHMTYSKVVEYISEIVEICDRIEYVKSDQMIKMLGKKREVLICFKKYPQMKFVSPVIESPFNFSKTLKP